MPAPDLMFEHALTPLKGWMDEAALDFSAKLSANVTFVVPRGRVVHLNASGEFEMGVGELDMAIFLLNGSEDFDVDNPGTTTAGNFMHHSIAPAGTMSGLVAAGGYELETTEFNGTDTYAIGDLLMTDQSSANTDLATGGVLTNSAGSGTGNEVQQYEDPVCGIVSRGEYTNEHGVQALGFWPTWLPGVYTA